MKRVVLAGTAALLLAAGCTTAGGGGTGGPPIDGPTVLSFEADPSESTAPAVVALVWTVADSDSDDLTCSIDVDSDGIDEMVVTQCQGTHSRNVTFATPTTSLATLEVTDGTSSPHSDTALIVVTPGPTEAFDIELRTIGTMTPTQTAAFAAAEARWEDVVVRGIVDRPVSLAAGACLDGADEVNGIVDDLIIDIAVRPLDGGGGILGQAGPCSYWSGDDLPRVGIMEFDSWDVDGLIANGTFDDVVLHEMGHVLGIGTMWNVGRTLLHGAGTADPVYDGPVGTAEWSELGGLEGIPVENSGGPGTRDAHWRESILGPELMTGYIELGANPLSAMSIGSMADLGYHVDLTQGDAFSLPPAAARLAPAAPGVEAEVLRPEPQPG